MTKLPGQNAWPGGRRFAPHAPIGRGHISERHLGLTGATRTVSVSRLRDLASRYSFFRSRLGACMFWVAFCRGAGTLSRSTPFLGPAVKAFHRRIGMKSLVRF